MKKLIISTLTGVLLASSALGASLSITIPSNVFTNLTPGTFGLGSGYMKVTGLSLTAAATAATTVTLIDSPTNALTYVVPSYTNTVSYATNMTISWTNYWGNVNTNYGTFLVDNTNNVVAAITNNYPVRYTLSATTNTTTSVSSMDTIFDNGFAVTNNSGGSAVLTVTFQQ